MNSIKHSLLFVPVKNNYINKIKSTKADAVIFDLEDSIAEIDKDKALSILETYLQSFDYSFDCYVRVNGSRLALELEKLSKYKINGFMIPKFESISFLLDYINLFKGKEIIALIETPMGLVNIKSIVSCEHVTALAFGAEDYTASVGMKNSQEFLYYARSRLVAFAKAFNKVIYDTPSFNFQYFDDLEVEISQAIAMGFDGKMAIHPSQVGIINRMFNYHDYNFMEYAISEFEKQGQGVLQLDGRVFEKPHIDHYKKLVAKRRVD